VRWRCRLASCVGIGLLSSCLFGCSDEMNAGPLRYVDNDALVKDQGPKANLAGKTKLQEKVRAALAKLYGDNPRQIRVPLGAPLVDGGYLLASYVQYGDGPSARQDRLYESSPGGAKTTPQAGGYGVYRRNCLHCHGVSGAGDGPTAEFLFPIPRDFRKGVFKFTSTPSGSRPHRDDLRRTITNGLHGTSMPAFGALLSPAEIEQAVDYVIFLSIRGETELSLIEEGTISDENDESALGDDTAKEAATGIFAKWVDAQTEVVDPPSPRTPPTRESILRGRDLFSGRTAEKLECTGCHGTRGAGDGLSFVNKSDFDFVVFGGNPSERQARVDRLPPDVKTLWNQKPDDWGHPLRPANLTKPVYKGGRRPIDLFWRIAKGINGSQMPAHYPTPLNDQKVWDVVNFVLQLPYEPELLNTAEPPGPAVATTSAANSR
jgi:mono/diheme cytochrome c family protein